MTRDSSSAPHNDKAQPLIAHLIELRQRLLRCVLAVALVFLGLFYFANDIYSFFAAPLIDLLPEGSTMIATGVASPFLAPFKLTLVVAVLIAVPFILYQIWGFIAPGLYRHEKKLAAPLFLSSVILFYLGVVFAYYVACPLIFAFFASTGPSDIAYMPDIHQYLDFALTLFFAFGITFEIPIATLLLIITGTISTASLIQKRPYIIVGCFVVGMLLTPPDVFSQTLLAVPMWLLFELGIVLGRRLERQRDTDEAINS